MHQHSLEVKSNLLLEYAQSDLKILETYEKRFQKQKLTLYHYPVDSEASWLVNQLQIKAFSTRKWLDSSLLNES